jgi:hypothetical protein
MKNRPKETESDLWRKAILAFNQHFSGQGELEISILNSPPSTGRTLPDVLVHLRAGKRKILYHAEIKSGFSHSVRLYLLLKKASAQRPLLVMTRYVNPVMADQMRRDGLEFIDTAGNAFIHQEQLYIFAKGNRPPNRTSISPPPRLFAPSGLRAVFALLRGPDLVNGTYREIAAASGLALGTIAGIMMELKDRLFLTEDRKGTRRLIRKKDLFDGWVSAYADRLRPRVLMGRYQGDHGWWYDKVLQPAWAQWGGEVAASRITNYLYPQLITVYLAASHLNEFLLDNKLRMERNGNVEILERFWTEDTLASASETVHPILIYADLLASGNERNVETAKIIYDQRIARHLRED